MKSKQIKVVLSALLVVLFVFGIAGMAMASQITATKTVIGFDPQDPVVTNTFNPNETIDYVITVTNPEANPATNTLTRIWDTLPNGNEIEYLTGGATLVQAPGETETFYAEYTINWADVQFDGNRYYVENQFQVEGTDSLGDRVEATVNWASTITLPPLEVSKTAAGTYDRTVTWELNKSVDQDYFSGMAGDDFGPVTWTVEAIKNEISSNYAVSGIITIHNPAGVAQDFTVADVLNDGTPVVLSSTSGTIAAGGTEYITYTAAPTNGTATLNTATVTVAGNDPVVATAPVSFEENLIGYDEGLLTDPRFNYSNTISDSTTVTFEESFECTADRAMYVDGVYSSTIVNWAYLNGDIDLSASASVTIDCILPSPLEVSKSATGTYDRTVTWELNKSVDQDYFSGMAGDDFGPVTWTVEAIKNEISSNYAVSGIITIHNPAGVAQDFTVADVLNDGTPVVLSSTSGTIAAGGTEYITYTAAPTNGTATLNTATVSVVGSDPVVATAPVSFVENLIGYDEGLLTDPRFNYSNTISDSTTVTFEESFECTADAALYVDGVYSSTIVNWAYLNGDIDLSASASVTIDCRLPSPLEVSKTAAGTYDRTVTWELNKSVDEDYFSGMAGDDFGPVTWTVEAIKNEISSNYAVSGIITIHNPADVAQDFTVADVLNDGTPVVLSSTSGTIAAGGTEYITYTAAPTTGTATLNTATVTVAGNDPVVATASVSFVENLIGYDEGLLTDPRFNYSNTISDSTTVTFEESFECTADAALYVDGVYSSTIVNWAYLNGDIDLSASASVTIDCEMPIVKCYTDETAWAFGGEYANPNSESTNSNNWGWNNGPLSEGSYEFEMWAAAGQNDLNKGVHVGTVYVDYDNGCVTVTYETFEGYYLGEIHLWIGNDVLPMVKRGYTNAPGQFPYGSNYDFNGGVMETSWTTTECGFDGDIYVAAHAVVWMECGMTEIIIDNEMPGIIIDDGKPEIIKDNGKPEIIKDDGKPEIIKDNGKPEIIKDNGKPEIIKDNGKPEIIKDNVPFGKIVSEMAKAKSGAPVDNKKVK